MCQITSKQLSEILFALRDLYSTPQIAQLLGVSYQTVNNWENKLFFPRKIHQRRILQLARQCKVISPPVPA